MRSTSSTCLPQTDSTFRSTTGWRATQASPGARCLQPIHPLEVHLEDQNIIRNIFQEYQSQVKHLTCFRDNSSLEEAIEEYDSFHKFTDQQNFFMDEFKMKGESELLLLKVTGRPKGQAFVELSGSQVSALQIGKPLHGAVRSEQRRYKVYQLIYDRDSLYAPDLVIELQACRGSVGPSTCQKTSRHFGTIRIHI